MGAMSALPYASMPEEDWPDLPFVITNGVPLSMNLGYNLAGMEEQFENYLAYCEQHGSFRTNLFSTPTFLVASNALNNVLNSPAWKALEWKHEEKGWGYSYDRRYAERMLWKQVANMAEAH